MANPFQLDLLYDSKWNKYAAEAGIENPWVKYREKLPKTIGSMIVIDGKEIPCWETTFSDEKVKLIPSDEERVAYRRQEYLWKAKIIQPKTKWEDL